MTLGISTGVGLTATHTDINPISIETPYPLPTQGLNAYSVQIRFQASDLNPSSSRTSFGASDGSTSLLTPAATHTPDTSGSTEHGGMSTSTKIALDVAVPVVVIAALIVGVFFYRRRRSTQSGKSIHEQENPEYNDVYT